MYSLVSMVLFYTPILVCFCSFLNQFLLGILRGKGITILMTSIGVDQSTHDPEFKGSKKEFKTYALFQADRPALFQLKKIMIIFNKIVKKYEFI
jgi:hypothetical protein